MKQKRKPSTAYERAQKKVNDIKGFYGHLTVYLVVCTVVLLARGKMHFITLSPEALGNPDFLNWIDWNVFGTPIIWGIGLVIHALSVFSTNPFLGKAWEERQIKKYMEKDNPEF